MTDFVLKRWHLEPYPGDQAPPHIHDASDEAFCVISGNLEVLVGVERRVLHQGDFIEIPAGTVHTFATFGDEPVTMLAIMTNEINDLVTSLHLDMSDVERSSIWATFRSRLA